MESSLGGTILSLVPFILAILLFGGYLFYRSLERRTVEELTEIRSQVRAYQKEYLRLQKEASTFSPQDPEPYGAMAEQFIFQMMSYETSIKEVYSVYSQLHQQAIQLKKIPAWKLWYLPSQWYQLNHQVSALWQNLEGLENKYQSALLSSKNISHLGIELSNQSRDVMNKLRESLQIHHELISKLNGDSFLGIGRHLKEWEGTLETQVPLTFLSTVERPDSETQNKESITQVHRVLKTAVPEISGLYDKLKKWKTDLEFITNSLIELRKKHQQVMKVITDLEKSPVSPLQWGESQIVADDITHQLDVLESVGDMRSVEDLRDHLHLVKRLEAKLGELGANCLEAQDQYLDLLRIWSSIEVQRGSEWIRNAKQVIEQTRLFDGANFKAIDDVEDFRGKVVELSRLQSKLLPKDPAKAVPEKELPGLTKDSRKLYELHLNLRPRLEKINSRLKEIQRLQDEVKEKISGAKSVLTKTLPVIASNPFLKKTAGNLPAKMQVSLENINLELDASQQGVIEIKAQKYAEWAGKAEQAFNKWLSLLSEDVNVRQKILGDQFQTLGNFNNLEDVAITDVREILKKAEQGISTPPLSRPGDMPLLVIANQLWAKNDHWQQVVAAGRALDDIAGPVLERYQKAEKSRQLAIKRLEKCEEVVPDEPGWPPTTQYVRSERKQAQTLDESWQSLRWEHIQAIQLVGRLSDLSEQYQGLAVQLQQVIEKAEQEQKKVTEYERRLEEAKRLWLNVVGKYPEYKSLQTDVENFFAEIDQDHEGLKKRSMRGGLPYNQVLQNLRSILHKINEATMPAAGNQVIDINGELQKRLY